MQYEFIGAKNVEDLQAFIFAWVALKLKKIYIIFVGRVWEAVDWQLSFGMD